MKSPVELNSFILKLLVEITWFDETRHWTPCKRGLYVKSFCFFETIQFEKNPQKNISIDRIYSFKKPIEENVNRLNIFLWYFYYAYDVICEGKISSKIRLIHAELISLQNFSILRKNDRDS